MNDILLILLSLSVSGSILLLLLFALKPFVKNRLSNTWQYYIWFIIILRFLLPITAELNFIGYAAQYIENSITTINQTSGQFVQKSDPEVLIDGETWPQTPQTENDAVTPAMQNVGKIIQDNIWIIWASGMLMMFFYKVISYNAFVRFVKNRAETVTDTVALDIYRAELASAKVRRKIPLKINDRIGSPMLAGIIQPILVIPSLEVGADNLKFIFRHELTHYRRGDIFYKWFAQITKCVHWFNPLVYMVSKQIDQSCELSCDEVIIKHLDKAAKESYGDALIASLKSQENYGTFVVSMTMSDSKIRLKERLDAIMKFKKQSKFVLSITLVLTIAICFGATAIGAYAAPKQTNTGKVEITENNGVIAIPVNIKSIAEGEYVWLGEYTLSAGDKIRYNIPTITGENIAVGFARSTSLTPVSPTYFTSINNRNNGILAVKDGFDVPANFAGKYTLFIQACLGKLENISGTIEIGKVVDEKSNQSSNIITVPINIPNAKNGEFIYLGEYSFSQGDKIHFNVSAATGDGMEVGLVSPKDDPLNRTHYTSSTKRYNGVLEINSDSIFSDPVKAGNYKLFVHATDDLTNIKGNISITKQAFTLETVTLKDKTYYMITTKEQLLALAAGQLDFDKDYMLQKDIDLSDVEWTPIGTADKPFTGSFNGNGCEIKGLTMTDPDAKIIGMFGYADGANIYNITLRDYDIATAGKNVKDKSVSPILVFGLGDTRSYDNNVYAKQ